MFGVKSVSKKKMNQSIKQNSVALAIMVAFLIGIYLFYLAFIYQDNTTGKFNPQQNPYHSKMRFKDEQQKQIYLNQWFPTQSEQLLFQVIDGFYFPWAIDKTKQQEMKNSKDETSNSTYFTDVIFKEPINRLIAEPKNTILMEAYADGPTLSAVRIKSILRGNMPLHIEVMNNLRGIVMPDDNIVYQSKVNGQGKKVHFFGFMYWDQFVGKHFDKKFITDQEPFTKSMEDDKKIFNLIVEEQGNKDWSTIFSHYEALDMVVHAYASVGINTYSTVNFHDNQLRDLIDSTKRLDIEAETIIYLSDHGQNERHFAQHGGYTDLEKQVILFGYDRRGFIQKEDRDIGQIMDRKYLLSPIVNQIDITATYCMLKGIPLPSVNIGIIIPDFFINRPDVDNTVIVNNYFVNVQQIYTYISIIKNEKQRTILSFGEIQTKYSRIMNQYNNLFDQYEQSGIMTDEDVKEYVGNCIDYARFIKKVFLDEISGPNLLFTKATVIYFFLAALSSYILIQILSSKQYNLQKENIENLNQKESPKQPSKKVYYKIGMISFVCIFGFLSIFSSTLTSFSIFYAFGLLILFYFIKIQSQKINCKSLIIPYKISNSYLYGLIDTFLIISGIVFNAALRLTNDLFERTYDLTQMFLLVFYAIWLLMVLFSRKISILQKLYLIILIIITPALTYSCGYHSHFKNFKFNQYFINEEYVKYFASVNVRFYYPMTILGLIYTILIYKSCKAIHGSCHYAKKVVFALLCYSQLYCLFNFYYIQSLNIEKQNGKEVYDLDINYLFVAQILFFITEIYKLVFINRTPLNPPNFSWKYATFLMNFYLQALYVLHYDSLIKYSTLLLIVYLVGHLYHRLQIMESGSKYVFLYLLTSWFFYVSEHMERLPDIHTDVLNAGAMFGGIFYPLLNGTFNTFFGQFSISLIVPLFVLNEKYQINSNKDDQPDDQKSVSFLDVIFSNYSQIVFFSNEKNSGDYYKNMNIRAYLYFIIPIFFSFGTAILRNAIKPFDYFINHYYIPSFFYQVMFLVVILISFLISYLLIKIQKNKSLDQQHYYDYLISEKAEKEVELERRQENDI
ncbi:type I phosphodiesterase/nucleotide pyrophosphatase (macronuclear) [Tetrahymena thermophila SB210]|uniref:Type I phosphodiesterase/nucleotide pyrophosphatase n=1 Tax=Tetrahymena thermophila (strain SB210) TaxID=312017 RepID=W7X8P4_TETTS|nr:type I phosphodiesterase/nucleotide pyrophosphatase [Tetrahymena thermophila SB210]EWS72773.1 type I phosphodiesterase/nucleotide pyrophosphatase [Tetrahymena thermophila SB210]|eukprot:XP_012654710.1 type I phosphodiesterase/nucleotide pyrophosphatase [Tetrahymena thermophila SB210]